MLSALKFCLGAASKKDFVPSLKHFVIEDGVARSFNGITAMSAPVDFDINCKPRADQLVKAIERCNETISLHMTATGRLAVRSGPFNAYIPCVEEETPHVQPDGMAVHCDGRALIEAFELVEPFVGSDQTRAWGTGVLIRNGSVYATNNVTLVEYWMGQTLPFELNIPRAAIAEVIRVNEPLVGLQVAERSVTFHFGDKRWIRTSLLSTSWPDLSPILDRDRGELHEIPSGFFDALDAIAPFCDKQKTVYIYDGIVTTVPAGTNLEEGAFYRVEGLSFEGIYRLEMLQKLKDVAVKANFNHYPNPCLFYGERLRGAIVGMKA